MRASRILATPIVMAWLGTFSSPKKPAAASRRVMLSRVTMRVREVLGDPGSLKPMCPVRPMPSTWISTPPASRILRSYSAQKSSISSSFKVPSGMWMLFQGTLTWLKKVSCIHLK